MSQIRNHIPEPCFGSTKKSERFPTFQFSSFQFPAFDNSTGGNIPGEKILNIPANIAAFYGNITAITENISMIFRSMTFENRGGELQFLLNKSCSSVLGATGVFGIF